MRYIEFGTEKKLVSEIMIGLMRISEMETSKVTQLINTGLEEGINALDIADCYSNGKCEEILGEVFAKNPELREEIFLQTKCGIRKDSDFTYFDFSKNHILEAVDASLMRLQTDHIDSLLLHRPDALMEPEEIAEAFEILKKTGKVLDFGVSNMNPMMMDMVRGYMSFPITANQIQLSCAFTPSIDAGFNVNMLHDKSVMRDGGILEYCHFNDIVVQAWSALQYGYFEGVFLNSDKYPKLNQVIDRIAKERGVANTAVALAWILRHPGKMQAVIGTTKASRVKDAAGACDFVLTKKEWYEIYLSAGNVLP